MIFLRRVVIAMIVAAALTACGSTKPTPWLTADQTAAEYFDEAHKLTLAPGWEWPAVQRYESVGPDGHQVVYEKNAGRVDAAWYWHCSWGRAFFAATTNAEREAALAEVLRLPQSAFYKFGLEQQDRLRRDKVLEQAAAGDTTTLLSVIEQNCPTRSARSATTPPTTRLPTSVQPSIS